MSPRDYVMLYGTVGLERNCPGMPEVITRALKSRELSPASGRRGRQGDLKHKPDSVRHCWPREKEGGQPLGAESREQSPASSQQGNRYLTPTAIRNGILPTT